MSEGSPQDNESRNAPNNEESPMQTGATSRWLRCKKWVSNGLMTTPEYESQRRKIITGTLPIANRMADGPQPEPAIELELQQLGHWKELLSNAERATLAETLFQHEVSPCPAANDRLTGQGEDNQRTCVNA
eukprot:GHVU01013027.1.p1 GENE.GHVU01013027.1~~GHVU01013027.1.p1  ORF type:complete len:131 (+),score=10.15 GHVU01013027.1:593-985(+)